MYFVFQYLELCLFCLEKALFLGVDLRKWDHLGSIYIYIHHFQKIRRCTSSSPAKQDQFQFSFFLKQKQMSSISLSKQNILQHPHSFGVRTQLGPRSAAEVQRCSVAQREKAQFFAWHPPGHEEVYPGRIHIQLPNKVRTGDSFSMTFHVSLMIYFR